MDNSTALLTFTVYIEHMSNIIVSTPTRGKTELKCKVCKETFHRFDSRHVSWTDIAYEANLHNRKWMMNNV